MKRFTFGCGVALMLCALAGCSSLEKMQAEIEAEQKAEAQRRAETKRRIEKQRTTADKRRGEGKKTAGKKRRGDNKLIEEKLRRRDGEDMYAWIDRAGRIINTEEENRIFHEMLAAEREREKNHTKQLMIQTEKELQDPVFKYPYSQSIAGVELYDGYLSGLAYQWIATLNFLPDIKRVAVANSAYNGDVADDLAKAKKSVREMISHKNATLYFDKQYGVLYSVVFKIEGSQEAVTKKIEEYKTKHHGLKHTRKTQRDGRKIIDFPVSYRCVWNICTDTLESDHIKIVITSNVLIGLENFVIGSSQLSDLQKKQVVEMHKKAMRDNLEKNAVVTITDKAMQRYFSAQKSAPAAK